MSKTDLKPTITKNPAAQSADIVLNISEIQTKIAGFLETIQALEKEVVVLGPTQNAMATTVSWAKPTTVAGE